ncbi:MAG: inositol monophosphatase family protein [Fuerstiella sp.]
MNTLDVARQAAVAAGSVLSNYFGSGVAMRTKSASVDLVSDADVNAERAVAEVIRSAFPDHSILGEEENSGSADAEHLWIVDPLDGTTNFAHGIPHFAVSIAYYRNGVAETAVVYNPIREDWYVATKGGGAFHNDQPIVVGDQQSLDQVVVGTGFHYDRGEKMEATLAAMGRLLRLQIHGIRRFGTASLDLAMVATGQLGVYFEYQLSSWDFAAGVLLVEEAGGRVSTSEGEPLKLATTSILAANPGLYEIALPLVNRNT